ncbi:amino acid permease [bacterium AH-315-E10]|nr:amino acid permease [bacterium AH-315-E10]
MKESSSKPKRLKKDLTLLSVYALATGATLSSGLFLLPGPAYMQAGPAIVLCYLIAMLPLIPAMFSMVELATAMPRAGGAYYFLDRSLGPLIGTIGGFGTWMVLVLKTSFALIGMGAYIGLFYKDVPMEAIAAGIAVLLAVANMFGAEKSGTIQIFLVCGLLSILSWFIIKGVPNVNPLHFAGFFDKGSDSIIATAGLVYISYVGVTKIASVAEEVKDPERNLPRGVFLAMFTAMIVYGIGTYVIVGVLPGEMLAKSYTPVADAAVIFAGQTGKIVVTIAALLAFFAVANAGILSASRYPLAMSRDHIIPRVFSHLNEKQIPINGILVTLVAVLIMIFAFDVISIAKLASAFQLLLFAFLCMAVIVMRESQIDSYDPGFRSPFYPWMQIAGIILPFIFIPTMGWMTIAFSAGLVCVGVAWYQGYARQRIDRHGAIFHVFERLGRRRENALDVELRGILKEKGLRSQDPYDDVIIHATVLDFPETITFEKVTEAAAQVLEKRIPLDAEQITKDFLEGTGLGATPVSHGAALPHMRVADLTSSEMVIVRASAGVRIEGESLGDPVSEEPIYAMFYLVSPTEDPSRHLRILAQLATRMDQEDFMDEWKNAKDEHGLRETLLRDERFVSFELIKDRSSSIFIGKSLRKVNMPPGCLIAVIYRDGESIVPGGNTKLEEGDRLTIIGEPAGVKELFDTHVHIEE